MADLDTLLLAVTEDYTVQIGLPPRHLQDNFSQRAVHLGKVDNISALACSPDGELFCIRSGDVYRGPIPSKKDLDWFTVARRVGRFDWGRVICLAFHPKGDLYCTTHGGELYKGPPPDNEHVPWFYDRATKIGKGHWNGFAGLSFDAEGNMYGGADYKFYTGPPPTDENVAWKTQVLGENWERYTHFMAFTKDNKLWCVDKYNGNIFRGDKPTPQQLQFLLYAKCLGWGYNTYKFLALVKDRTISNIISFDFLIDEGKKQSETPEVLEEKLYDNRGSSTIMRHTYTISKTVKEISSFSHEHGFTFEVGMETSFKGGIPHVSETSTAVKLNMSTTHTWNMTKVNETETSFESSTNVELEPGKAIKMVSSVMKAEMHVPYKAIAHTLFGSAVEIRGMWKGISHYNLIVKQEDFNK